VKKVCVTLGRGEYGIKLYFDSCNGKCLTDSQLSYSCLVALKYDKVLGKVVHIIII
jgi:hypothetical protein